MTQATAPEAPAKGTGDGEGKPAPTPKRYVFGGSLNEPEMGANSRRLWRYLKTALNKKQQRELRKAVLDAQPKGDRFIRWQRIVAAAEKAGISLPPAEKGGDPRPINQALVRRLAIEDKKGKIGRDDTIKFVL
jgi:hypothetical protein